MAKPHSTPNWSRMTKAQLIAELERLETQGGGARKDTTPYRTLTDAAIHGNYVHADKKILYVNQAMADIFGYADPDEMLALDSVDAIIAPEDLERMTRYREDRLQKRADPPSIYEFRGLRKDGELIWVQVSARAIEWMDRTVIHGSMINISKRVHTDEARRDQLELLQTMIDAIPAPIFFKDTNHIYQGCNTAFEAFIGMTKDQVQGASVYDVAPKELAEIYRAADDELFETRGTQVYEATVQYADGTDHNVIFHKAVFEKSDGSVGGLIGVMLDITERKQAENALFASQHLFQLLLENAPDPMFVHSLEGRPIQVNDLACKNLGYSRDELLAMTIADIEVGFTLEELQGAWAEMPLGMKSMQGDHRRKDGTIFPVEVHVSKLAPGEGKPPIFVALARDITERMAAESRLLAAKSEAEDANRAKSEFLANMSHELRTPLNAILGFSEVIHNEILGPVGTEAYLEYAGDIRKSGTHLLQIISDLLDVSSLEIDTVKLDQSATSIAELVATSLKLQGDGARNADLVIATVIPEDLPKLVCDPRRIVQVLVNLISNAVKFTPAPGQIEINAWLDREGGIRLSVSDTGIGIAPVDIPKALQPFEQLENTMTRRHMGAGLGLALSKSLVELHGGELMIDSALGKGTRVTIAFPASRTLA